MPYLVMWNINMPDITGWDPSIVAQAWMYIFAAFVIGIVLGFFLYKFWFKREIGKHEDDLQKLEQLEKDYLRLQQDIKESKEYWIYMQKKNRGESDVYNDAANKLKA